MTKAITLAAVSRAAEQSPNTIRAGGGIPGVLYGKGTENRSVAVKRLEFERAYADAGETNLVDLAIDGGKPVKVIIKDIQRDPVSGAIDHLDLYLVRMDEALEVAVPLEFVGIPPAVADLGGTLVKSRDTLELKCLPGALPENIVVDLSVLRTFEDAIRVRDLAVPADVELLIDPEESVAHVLEPKAETEPEAAPAPAEPAPAPAPAKKE